MNAALVCKLLELQASAWEATARLDERNAKGWQEDADKLEAGADGQTRYEAGYSQARHSQGLAHARELRELADAIEQAGKDDDGWR